MHTRLRTIASRINWKSWSVAVTTASLITTHCTLAICDNHNINDNHITPFLTKELASDELIIQSKDNADIHLKSFKKPDNSFLEWGMYSKSKSPKHNRFFDDIHVKTIKFSRNAQLALDIDGNLYCKYANDTWTIVDGFKHIQDIAITNDMIYMIDANHDLLELQYHSLPNKYSDPCLEKCLKSPKHCDMENCLDHRRKKSFSSMPMSRYHDFNPSSSAGDEAKWTSSTQFAQYLNASYRNKDLALVSDISRNETLSNVYANDYRVFALSRNGDVFVRGDNQRGACGVSDSLYIGAFERIDRKYFDSAVIKIGIGEDHTLFATKLGRVFSCGSDNLMQLGLGWTKRKCIKSDVNWSTIGEKGFVSTAESFDRNIEIEDDKDMDYFHEVPSYDEFYPRVITGPLFDDYKVIAIDCGDYHNAVIIEPLYSLKNPLKRRNREIDAMSDDEMIELKRELVENRRVITWGCGLYGQLGHCNYTNACEPKPVKPLEQYKEFNDDVNDIVRIKPIEIKCGKEHTVVLMEGYADALEENYEPNKMVFAFGNNRYNQVSNRRKPKQNSPYWIQSLLPQKVSIDMIAAGNFQSAAFGQSQRTQYQF